MVPDRHRIQFGVDRCLPFPTAFTSDCLTQIGGKGLSSASALDSQGDEGYDILSNPSASSLHQIRRIHELGTRGFVRAVVERVRGQP
jgi:hypothetical protein